MISSTSRKAFATPIIFGLEARSNPDLSANALMSPSTSCGHDAALALGSNVPKPAVSNRSKADDLFDHLVGAQQQRGGQLNADRLRGLEVDDQLVFDRLLDR